MEDEAKCWFFGIIIGLLIGCLLGACAIGNDFRREAVEKGFAEYESKSGKWQWVERQPARKSRDFLEAESVQPNFQGLE